jgi:hypothetical protein
VAPAVAGHKGLACLLTWHDALCALAGLPLWGSVGSVLEVGDLSPQDAMQYLSQSVADAPGPKTRLPAIAKLVGGRIGDLATAARALRNGATEEREWPLCVRAALSLRSVVKASRGRVGAGRGGVLLLEARG